MKKLVLTAALSTALVANAYAAGRDTISVVGSSTVYPFATVVAERFGKKTSFSTPKIESTGSGGGMKLFCNGVGLETPDITNASRRIKKSEFDLCQKNGVTDIVEAHIGFDGIAVANSNQAEQLELTRKDLFLALAKQVPNEPTSRPNDPAYLTNASVGVTMGDHSACCRNNSNTALCSMAAPRSPSCCTARTSSRPTCSAP